MCIRDRASTFGLPLGDGAIRGPLKKLIEDYNLPPVVFHSFRHSSVTYKLKLNGGAVSYTHLPISEIMLCITGVIFISALFFLDELFKSFTTGMWELEQTFKYDLRQPVSYTHLEVFYKIK